MGSADRKQSVRITALIFFKSGGETTTGAFSIIHRFRNGVRRRRRREFPTLLSPLTEINAEKKKNHNFSLPEPEVRQIEFNVKGRSHYARKTPTFFWNF